MRVKLFIDNGEDGGWKDFWFSEDKIVGFFIPDDEDDDLGEGINVYVGDNLFTFKREAHLVEFLADKYI